MTFTAVPDDTATRNQSFLLPAAFSVLSSPLTLQIYGYNAEGVAGTWRLANYTGGDGATGGLTVEGLVSVVPEASPAPVLLALTILAPALVSVRRLLAMRKLPAPFA